MRIWTWGDLMNFIILPIYGHWRSQICRNICMLISWIDYSECVFRVLLLRIWKTGNRNLVNVGLHVVIDKDMETSLKIKGHSKSSLSLFRLTSSNWNQIIPTSGGNIVCYWELGLWSYTCLNSGSAIYWLLGLH